MFRPWEDEQPHCKRELQAELSVSLPVTHEHVAHYNGPLDDGAGAVQRDSLPQILTPQLGSLHDGGRSDTGSPDYSSAAASARADTAEPALGHGSHPGSLSGHHAHMTNMHHQAVSAPNTPSLAGAQDGPQQVQRQPSGGHPTSAGRSSASGASAYQADECAAALAKYLDAYAACTKVVCPTRQAEAEVKTDLNKQNELLMKVLFDADGQLRYHETCVFHIFNISKGRLRRLQERASGLRDSRHGLIGRPSNNSKKPETQQQFVEFVRDFMARHYGLAPGELPPSQKGNGSRIDMLRARFNEMQQRYMMAGEPRETISRGTTQTWFRMFFPSSGGNGARGSAGAAAVQQPAAAGGVPSTVSRSHSRAGSELPIRPSGSSCGRASSISSAESPTHPNSLAYYVQGSPNPAAAPTTTAHVARTSVGSGCGGDVLRLAPYDAPQQQTMMPRAYSYPGPMPTGATSPAPMAGSGPHHQQQPQQNGWSSAGPYAMGSYRSPPLGNSNNNGGAVSAAPVRVQPAPPGPPPHNGAYPYHAATGPSQPHHPQQTLVASPDMCASPAPGVVAWQAEHVQYGPGQAPPPPAAQQAQDWRRWEHRTSRDTSHRYAPYGAPHMGPVARPPTERGQSGGGAMW